MATSSRARKSRAPRASTFRRRTLSLAAAACGVAALVAGARAGDGNFTFTTTSDFDAGSVLNLNTDDNELKLTTATEPFPFINVAASDRGTIVRINTETGAIVGEYRFAPDGGAKNPSRTTVDLLGNVWVSSRDEAGDNKGAIQKVGLIVGGTRADAEGNPDELGEYLAPPFAYSTCTDRDADGLIHTSRGLGNILPWPNVTDLAGGENGIVEDAQDECILIYQRLNDAVNTRHVSVDANNDIWAGGYPFAQRMYYKLDGETGAILDQFDARNFGCGGYGGFIDADGILWSASISQNNILRIDPATKQATCVPSSQAYGLGVDGNGFVWNAQWTSNGLNKIAPDGTVQPGFPVASGGFSSRGVAVTDDDDVWVAHSGSNTVTRNDNATGAVKKTIAVGGTPTGVAVDAAGKVWVTNYTSHNVMRIDPAAGDDGLGAVDLTVELGSGAGPYNYSDMTGAVSLGTTAPQGTWQRAVDSGSADFEWGHIEINTEDAGNIPEGATIELFGRAANNGAALSGLPFMELQSGTPFSLTGRFLEVRAVLKSNDEGESPVLSDLTVGPPVGEPCVGTCGDPAVILGDITAVDAGYILRASVELVECGLCLCDVDNNGEIQSQDALRDLQFAIGLPVTLNCPPPGIPAP
ncbi:MAG TPA: hypothetical protein VEC57_18475 [Candidatus Limnocylindrales bacterium]|nr:hypothetical protein [Candidatus Limnocylindrales bacterium]